MKQQTRAKISMALKGRPHTAEHCANVSAALKGKPHPHKPNCMCMHHRPPRPRPDVYPTADTKICSRCRVERPLDQFERRGVKDNRPRPTCIPCRKEREYGLTTESYGCFMAKQGGACAICGILLNGRLQVDHNHQTGEVRGLLCCACNRALGYFKDDIERIKRAVEYLGPHSMQ